MWEFWIDVGGTFTDCVAQSPSAELTTFKTLSSGVIPGVIDERRGSRQFVDTQRSGGPLDFWRHYELRVIHPDGEIDFVTTVERSTEHCVLTTTEPLPEWVTVGTSYELQSHEEAPILAIRSVLGLRLNQPIPTVSVRLGTTRGTNALLERTGARTGLITTRGFGDALLIGNQDRPRLFDLAIQKPEPLFGKVLEVDERVDANGQVLRQPDWSKVRQQLEQWHADGDVESIAICLLNSYRDQDHEQRIESLAREVGFDEVSRSSAVTQLIKFVSRGDTTVLDAYLQPVLREYVTSIRNSLDAGSDLDPDGETAAARSTLKVMTSSGGLVNAEHFQGCDSILSGPAGGVVGFSRIAEQAGFARSIGFDMGGTSTDVSRYDGHLEQEFETQKAGVRIMTHVLAIETVAAGGGSICRFDGVKLVVGPESAGADPGPACYGRGGPLSVTDVNLYLGRIPEVEFPFPLDHAAVEFRLRQMCDEINSSAESRTYTPTELAAGFVEIANANMVRAIRRISIARGYDPADYVLVTFGGAGGQHACAIARSLGMKQVLIHPYAGVLSAYGIGMADVRRQRETSVLKRLSDETLHELEAVFTELETATTDDVRREDVPAERITPPLRSLDLRYEGIEASINIPQPDDGDYASAYESLHEQMYGYRREGRPIEVVAARVEVVGKTPTNATTEDVLQPRRLQPTETTPMVCDGEMQPVGLFHRRDLRAGDEIVGPAILCEPTSTIVIDPGFVANITGRGDVLLTDGHSETASDERVVIETADDDVADPVLLEIFNNLFASIAEQMGVTLQKTSVSTNVKERLDFSCAIFDPDGGLVVNAPHIPVHLGAMGETVRRVIADNPDISPGDVFVTNDPYRGGSHLPDVTVVTPVHDSAGDLLFFTGSRAHHAEIGGITPGSMPPFSTSLAEEGVLIRNFKLVDRGDSRAETLRELLLSAPYPTRNVEDNLADIAAQVAANQAGGRLLRELIDLHSLDVVQAYMRNIQSAAARKMRLAIATLPDGERTFVDHLDDGSPIAVTVTIDGEKAVVDFTGTGPVLASNLNANRAIVTAAVLYVFRCLISEDIPLNSGVLDPIEIVLPECLLNPPSNADPEQCAAIVGGNVETSQRVVDVLLGALGVAAASQGTMNNLTFGDDAFGYYETICGGSGATRDANGADAVHTHMTNTRLTDIEIIERRYPVRIQEFSIRRGSGGAGRHRGGDGITRRIEFLAPLKISLLTQRRGDFPPFGLAGGQNGKIGANTLRRAASEEEIDLTGCAQVEVVPGDVLTIETPGGGGYD
ncbi:MAG: hydantoinase B/oxoprolinase family protein [Planctomycetaceae bacterium]|nr:hydantoinase B/oxoprolinase family protein [Planctomycetaceae bacterium]